MSKLIIKFNDGTEQRKCIEQGNSFHVKDGLLIIPKGRNSPSLYINLQNVKSFQEEER